MSGSPTSYPVFMLPGLSRVYRGSCWAGSSCNLAEQIRYISCNDFDYFCLLRTWHWQRALLFDRPCSTSTTASRRQIQLSLISHDFIENSSKLCIEEAPINYLEEQKHGWSNSDKWCGQRGFHNDHRTMPPLPRFLFFNGRPRMEKLIFNLVTRRCQAGRSKWTESPISISRPQLRTDGLGLGFERWLGHRRDHDGPAWMTWTNHGLESQASLWHYDSDKVPKWQGCQWRGCPACRSPWGWRSRYSPNNSTHT